MADLSSLTDEELDALAESRGVDRLSSLSDDELNSLAASRGIGPASSFALSEPSEGVGNLVSGADRRTEQTESLPELSASGLLAGEDQGIVARITPALATAQDPNEIAQIVTSNFPNVGVTYNRDAKGNVFPLLVNNKTGAATVINRPGLSGMDVLQTLGIGSAFFPGGRLGMVSTIGKDVATEAAIQGVQDVSGGEFNTSDVAFAAVPAGASKSAEATVSGVNRVARGSNESELVQAGDEFGVDVLSTDAVRPETFAGRTSQQVGEKIPVVGTGGRRAAQQEDRIAAVDNEVNQYGEFDYGTIVDSLKRSKDAKKAAAGSVIESTGNQLDTFGEIPIDAAQNAIAAARRAFTDERVIQSGTAMSDLETLMEALSQPQTFTTLKQNRTAFRELVNGVDRADRTQLPSRAKALLREVETALGDDMDAFARQNLSRDDYVAWRRANADYANEAKELTKTKLKNVLDSGETRPSVVANMLLRSDVREMRLLARNLDEEGLSHARAAVIAHAVDKASRRAGGLTPNSFANELKKLDGPISAFFDREQKRQLKGLEVLLDGTRRAQDSSASTPTGQQLIPLIFGGAGGAEAVTTGGVPVVTTLLTGTVGLAARAYESAAVRDILLRLASVPRGSTRFDQVLNEAVSALRAIGQSTPNEQQLSTSVETSLPQSSAGL